MSAPCACIDLTDKALAEHNTKLSQMWLFQSDGSILTTVEIGTEIVQKKRGARPKRIIPTYCPFCATRYVPEES